MVLGMVQQRLYPGLREAPSARIQRLFLCPDNVLGVGIHVQILLQLGPRERIQLLNTCDRRVFDFFVATVLVERSVDLAGAEDDALNVFWRIDLSAMLGVRDDPLEVRVSREVFDG